MNWIEKAVGAISPEAALRRAKARLVLAQARGLEKLAYDGAKSGRLTDGWFRPGTSANAETGAGLVRLRDGARDIVRNNPYGRNALIQFGTKIVGTGIRPQARTGDQRVNEILDTNFEIYARQTRYYQMQALGVSTIIESGEAVLRFYPRRPEDGLVVPFQPRLLEPDYIDHSKTGQVDGGGYIIQGVEFDQLDNEVAVWMFPSHPGDTINTAWYRRPSLQSYRVPVEGTKLTGVVRGFRQDRPGQVRGITWFAPVLTTMWHLAGLEEAERVRKRIEACLAAFVTSPEAGDYGTPQLGAQTQSDTGDLVEEFRPGMVARLKIGEDVKIAEPKAAGGFVEYCKREDRKIAVGMGLLYELLTGDLSNVNYSSYRGGLVGQRDSLEQVVHHVVIPWVGDPLWTRFVDGCKIGGLVPADTPYGVEWATPAFDLLDRLNEAQADETEIRNGLSTWDDRVSARGYDPTKQAQRIEERNKDFDAREIVLDCDPRKVARTGVMQKTAEPAAQQPAA